MSRRILIETLKRRVIDSFFFLVVEVLIDRIHVLEARRVQHRLVVFNL